jgi:hypothetical protein
MSVPNAPGDGETGSDLRAQKPEPDPLDGEILVRRQYDQTTNGGAAALGLEWSAASECYTRAYARTWLYTEPSDRDTAAHDRKNRATEGFGADPSH